MSDPQREGQAAECTSFKTDILPKFTAEDIQHMKDMVDMDLSDYETVKKNGDLILERLLDPDNPMPPPPRGPWPKPWIDCFRQWLVKRLP
jgi:hypothetical protein